MPTSARNAVPNSDQTIATTTSGCGTAPMSGSSVMLADSRSSTGRKAISVITESTRLTPSPSSRGREAHGVFLDALRGALDVPQPRPVRHVVVVHRRAPAEDVVADEEARQHADHDRDEGDAGEVEQPGVEFRRSSTGRDFAERRLDQVVERPVPVVDRDADLHLEIGGEEDQRRAEDRPAATRDAARRCARTAAKSSDAEREVDVEPEERPRPETRDADRRRPSGGWRRSRARRRARRRRRLACNTSQEHPYMATVRQLLNDKGYDVFTVGPGETVFDAIRKMAEENIGSLVVCEGPKPVGIITERHYARNVFLKGRASPSTLVQDIMET